MIQRLWSTESLKASDEKRARELDEQFYSMFSKEYPEPLLEFAMCEDGKARCKTDQMQR